MAPRSEEHRRTLGSFLWIRHEQISQFDGLAFLEHCRQGEFILDREGKLYPLFRITTTNHGYKVPAVSHVADFAYGPLFAILAEFQNSVIPKDVVEKLTNFSGEHTFTSSTFSPPFDIYPRNITAWLAPNISIGAETFNETVIGGPAKNPNTFNPAVIQWDTGNGIGFINVRQQWTREN